MNERKFLPDIPVMPEERAAAKEAGMPVLPGAPGSAEESMLLSVPMLERVDRDMRAFVAITQTERRKSFLYNKIGTFINDPKEFEAYFDSLRIVGENWQGRQAEVRTFQNSILEDIEKFIDVGTLTPEAFNGWFRLMVQSEIYRPTGERIIHAILDKAKSPQALVNFMYNLSEAVLIAEDEATLRLGVEVLMLMAPFLEDEIEPHINYSKAMFTIDDDNLLRKAFEVDTVLYYLGSKYVPESFERMKEKRSASSAQPAQIEFIERMTAKDPDKMRQLLGYLRRGNVNEMAVHTISDDRSTSWPYTIVLQGGKVRELLNVRLERDIPGHVSLTLPNQAKSNLFKRETVATKIIAELEKPAGDGELRDPKYLKALFYVSPQVSPEETATLRDDVTQLRREINMEKNYAISPRGDRMLIVDQDIKEMGIKSITFKVEEHAPSITGWVEVGNYKFMLTIDPDFEVKDLEGKRPDVSFEDAAFTEHLILSHLKELTCTITRILPGEREITGEALVEREKEFKDRRAHLRKLAPNNAYTGEALAQGLLDPFKYDLARINAELGLTKATGQKTYVKVSIKAIPGEDPIISRAPHATDRLKGLIAKSIKTGRNDREIK